MVDNNFVQILPHSNRVLSNKKGVSLLIVLSLHPDIAHA